MWTINAPQGYPLRDFHKICTVSTPFQDALAVKILLDFLKGLWSYGGFKLTGSGYRTPKFSVPLTHVRLPKRGARMCSRSSITKPSLVGLGFHPPPGRPKTFSVFLCLFVCLSDCLTVCHAFKHQRLCAQFRHEGIGIQKRF